MKKLILLLLPAFLMVYAPLKANTNITGGIDDFYKHLTSTIKYPEKARLKDLQGHSIILFTVTDGKLSNTNIYAELGSGCDVEVLNKVLAYTNFKTIKNGKYALRTSFKLEGSTSAIENENFKMPDGYIALNVTIVATPPPTTAYLVPKGDSDQVNNNFSVKWRGTNIPTNTPKIIIDDKEIAYAQMSDIDPKTIASIQILRDGSALTKYGVSAVNGIIIITTKTTPSPVVKKEVIIDKKN
jgi:TonB-dependent SusC/RagA subfamily outer membrane receptor